jgi:hypothetical protein
MGRSGGKCVHAAYSLEVGKGAAAKKNHADQAQKKLNC